MSSPAMDFHSQIASIMEVLANAAVAEICKVVDDGYAVVHLEMSQSQKESEFLRRKIKLLELQIARYKAERMKGLDGSTNTRFPGVRLLNRHRDTTGPYLQARTRFLNRGLSANQSVTKSQPINLDQDPDQEVVTTTKMESADLGEDGREELLIVKVEGAVESKDTVLETPAEASVVIDARGGGGGFLSPPGGLHPGETEVSGSDIITLVVSHSDTPYSPTDDPTCHSGSAVRAGTGPAVAAGSESALCGDGDEGRARAFSQAPAAISPGVDCAATRCGRVALTRQSKRRALGSPACTLPVPEVIVIDGGPSPGQEEGRAAAQRGVRKDPNAPTSNPRSSRCRAVPLGAGSPVGPGLYRLNSAPGTSSRPASHAAPRDTAGGASPRYRGPPPRAPAHARPYPQGGFPVPRPYSCTTCPKRFLVEADLRKHMACHSRKKPYACPVCGKSFVCRSQLEIHGNVHTGERPFSCATCNRHFTNPSNLKRHQRMQH